MISMSSSRFDDGASSLEAIFGRFDDEVRAFTAVASLSCPNGCGSCCDHADTEVTSIEAGLIARYIRTVRPDLEKLLASRMADRRNEGRREESESDADRAAAPESAACVFYDPTNADHCLVYPVRPLICRAFGYSAYSDRSGNRLFAICPCMPIAGSRGGAMQVLFEPYPPVVEHYASMIAEACDRAGATRSKLPLGEAVSRALSDLGRDAAEEKP
jgi:Fe-S-cluster containining protein